MAEAIRRCVDRTAEASFPDDRSVEYLWEAIGDGHIAPSALAEWVRQAGDCWMLCDRAKGRAWKVPANRVVHLSRQDVYLVPVCDPITCYVSPHEREFGTFLLHLNASETKLFQSGIT